MPRPRTDDQEEMLAGTVMVNGFGGEPIHAYYARPAGPGPFPGMVLLHHMPGWDEWYKEAARKFAYYGFATIAPDLYCRVDHGTPEDVAAKVRADGGIPDAGVVADSVGARDFLRAQPNANGKVGIFGTCSGGRHAYLTVCSSTGWDAAADLWGGGVVMKPEDLSDKRPVPPVDLTKDLCCPLLGLFGEEDRAPTVEQVSIHEEALKANGKEYEFHMYPDAGHGFFYHHAPAAYRAEAAVDGWRKVMAFFRQHLGTDA